MNISDLVFEAIQKNPGLTDRELTTLLFGPERAQQPVNQACRRLEARGLIVRTHRDDGRLGNYVTSIAPPKTVAHASVAHSDDHNWLSEDQVKNMIMRWLTKEGWRIDTLNLGKSQGIDIIAVKNELRWIIEAKGQGSRPQMRENYFLGVLGKTLQRMDDPKARYSIAMPMTAQFRRLWSKLPQLAKLRTEITAIFVSPDGSIAHEE